SLHHNMDNYTAHTDNCLLIPGHRLNRFFSFLGFDDFINQYSTVMQLELVGRSVFNCTHS
ncbi:hypothetical protein ACJX0J_015807, partial [Zea mays]